MDLYSKMLAMQKRKHNRSKRKIYYDCDNSDSSNYEESIEDDYERRKKKPSNKKNKVRVAMLAIKVKKVK